MSGQPHIDPVVPRARVANIANVLTGLRLALVPVFLVFLFVGDGHETFWRIAAFIVFAVAVITDRFDGELIGCGALHVLWSDLGEVRTVAVHPKVRGHGVGHAIVNRLLDVARELHLERIFVLTFEVEFFSRHGFEEIEGTPVTAEVYEEMCRSYDTGVAEFLDLSYVKPNILDNTRMLLTL